MATKSFTIRKSWIKAFTKCQLVDIKAKTYRSSIAYQLFHGKKDKDYPSDFPSDFKTFYNTHYNLDRADAIDEMLRFLSFIGIHLSKENLTEHLRDFPSDFHEILRKTYFLLRMLANQKEDFDYLNPFKENLYDLSYLVDIETGKRQLSMSFQDYELPQLYNRNGTIPEGYGNDPIIEDLFDRIEHSNKSFFLTGKAGTGNRSAACCCGAS